jgi:hypothetical protein
VNAAQVYADPANAATKTEATMEAEYQADGHSEGRGPPQKSERLAECEWSELARDLEMLGRQLSELGVHTAFMGSHLVQSLQAQYQKVKIAADAWKRATERQFDEISNSAAQRGGEAQGAYSDMRERSKAAAHEIWERSEPLRQGARDVGEGIVRAWSELRASFGKAAGRLSSSEPSASDRAVDDHRDAS